MTLLPSCWWRLAFVAVVSGFVMQALAREPAPAAAEASAKSRMVKRHVPDSAPAAEAKASLRTKQFGAALQGTVTFNRSICWASYTRAASVPASLPSRR
jgi:hypothetical protein